MAKDQQPRQSRSQAVYSALKRAILEQALKPGVKLPEDTIGEQFGVSRTLVREALVRLSGEGLVDLRANKGASVAEPSLEDIEPAAELLPKVYAELRQLAAALAH